MGRDFQVIKGRRVDASALLKAIDASRLIVDEIDRCSTGDPLDEVVAKESRLVDGKLNREPTQASVAKPEANSSVSQGSEGDIGISLDNDR